MCNRIRWTDVLSNPLYVGTMVAFGTKQLSGKRVERIFRLMKDHETSGQVRKLIRERGVGLSRRMTKKALKRRDLLT